MAGRYLAFGDIHLAGLTGDNLLAETWPAPES
jgi:hypothetical protein